MGFGSAARFCADKWGRHNVWPLAHPVRDALVNGALFCFCSCAYGTAAPGAHLLALERMVANKPAPQHTILVCAMSSLPGQAGGPGDQTEVTLLQDTGGALAGDFKADGGHAQPQALRSVWGCFQELQGRLRIMATSWQG